jgi:ATP-dependent Zn protease
MTSAPAVGPASRPWLRLLGILVVAGSIGVAVYLGSQSQPAVPTRSYSAFLDDVGRGVVDKVIQRDQHLEVREGTATYDVVVPSVVTDVYFDMQYAAETGSRSLRADIYEAMPATDNSWVGLLLTGILPLLVIGGFIFLMMRRAQRVLRPGGLASRLDQLEEARKAGRISDSEYQAKRAQILESF